MNLNKSSQRRNKIMIKKYLERLSTSLAIRKMQIKTTLRVHLHRITMAENTMADTTCEEGKSLSYCDC